VPVIYNCLFTLKSDSNFYMSLNYIIKKTKAMKKVIYAFFLLTALSANATSPPEINEKVEKAFRATFADAENVNWYEADGNYQAYFSVSEITVKAIYDSDGKLLQTIRYYNEKQLPAIILARLKENNPERQVFGVTEISNGTEVMYHIVLKCDKNWYWIKSDPLGNMELTQKLKRGEPRDKSPF
jgi:hypothetical protein